MTRYLGFLPLFALAACGGSNTPAQDAANTAMADDTAAMPADENMGMPAVMGGQEFANAAAASDMFEIESSKIALEKSQSDAVKKFAQQMVDAHTESTAKLKTAAGQASPAITPDPTPPPDMAAKLDSLRSADAARFDDRYIAEQLAAHEKALAMLQSYAASGDVPPLKAFAGETAPIVAGHLEMARGLKP